MAERFCGDIFEGKAFLICFFHGLIFQSLTQEIQKAENGLNAKNLQRSEYYARPLRAQYPGITTLDPEKLRKTGWGTMGTMGRYQNKKENAQVKNVGSHHSCYHTQD